MEIDYPNLLNCLKMGTYTNEDFHTIVANLYGISRDVAKMAAVRCIYGAKKIDIIHSLINSPECSTSITNITDIFIAEDGKLRLNTISGYAPSDAHEFFYDNSNIKFFQYCCDYLTSWDACSEYYQNDFSPVDISMLASVIDNAKDERTIERIVGEFLDTNKTNKAEMEKMSWRRVSSLGHKSSHKRYDVREFLENNNYDLELAQKKFQFSYLTKYRWKRVLEDEKEKEKKKRFIADAIVLEAYAKANKPIPVKATSGVDVLKDYYPIVYGIPFIDVKNRKMVFFDILKGLISNGRLPSKELENLLKKSVRLQKRFMKSLLDIKCGMLDSSILKLIHSTLQDELNDVYSKLMYMYKTNANSTIDYTDEWKDKDDKRIFFTNVLDVMKNSSSLKISENWYERTDWIDKMLTGMGL